MSWHFLQGEEEACWPVSCLDGAPSVLLKLMPEPAESCSIDKGMELLSNSLSGMMLELSMETHGVGMLMSSQGASLAKISASVGQARESTVNDLDFGWKWRESFVRFDPSSYSWKTRQCSLLGGLDEFLETWPQWGWMRDGECLELPALEQPITEPDFSWLLTPTAQSWKAWTFRNPLSLIRKNHADGNLQEQLMRVYQRMTTPRCQEILMMWPEGWTASKQLEMAGFRLWLHEQSRF